MLNTEGHCLDGTIHRCHIAQSKCFKSRFMLLSSAQLTSDKGCLIFRQCNISIFFLQPRLIKDLEGRHYFKRSLAFEKISEEEKTEKKKEKEKK